MTDCQHPAWEELGEPCFHVAELGKGGQALRCTTCGKLRHRWDVFVCRLPRLSAQRLAAAIAEERALCPGFQARDAARAAAAAGGQA